MKLFVKQFIIGLKTAIRLYILNQYRLSKRKHSYVQIGTPIDIATQFVTIEDFTRIQPGVKIISNKEHVTIKKYTAVGAGCLIVPGAHTPTVGIPQFLSILHINDKGNGIVINEDCWIGAEAALLSKCEIGRGCVVGSRSVVTKNVPPYAVAVGSPAKIIATKFTLEQALEHERILYPPEERLSEDYLRNLFATTYAGLKAIGTSDISDTDMQLLQDARKKYGIA